MFLRPLLFFIRNGSNIDLAYEIQHMPAIALSLRVDKTTREMVDMLLAQCHWAETVDECFFFFSNTPDSMSCILPKLALFTPKSPKYTVETDIETHGVFQVSKTQR